MFVRRAGTEGWNGAPIALVMTSTITPPALMPDVAGINPELRLRDYQTAFRFYLDVDNGHIDEIIFS